MAIQDRSNEPGEGHARERLVMTECPLDDCRKDLSSRNVQTSVHFLEEHLPEDFGLTPLGERPDDVDGPVVESVRAAESAAQTVAERALDRLAGSEGER